MRYITTLSCPDRPGIVHAMAGATLEAGGNILENAQFADPITATFCMRTRFETCTSSLDDVAGLLTPVAESFSGHLEIVCESTRPRVLVMVSRLDHCLVDLLYRWSTGDLVIDIPVIVSNHTTCESVAERNGIPFLHLPIARDNKHEQEARLLTAIAQNDVDFIVLARYMQILSPSFCSTYAGRIINIHHSFLPGFKGAKPYHQAYDRGVKLVGATAHYVTADLDEGPIIEQDVVRVSHDNTPDQLVAIGRDVERLVLARAVRFQAQHRVFQIGHRTVVL